MSRREFKTTVKVAAFKRAKGKCETCGARLGGGLKTHYDHAIPDGLGGEPTLENCQVLCEPCHNEKTRKLDVPAIAKAKRIEAKRLGAIRPAGNIKSPGFARSGKQPRIVKTSVADQRPIARSAP